MEDSYYAYHFRFKPVAPWSEILVAHLSNLAFNSFLEVDSGLDAFITEKEDNETEVNRILGFINHPISYEKKIVKKVNWNEEWEKNFNPIHFGNQCFIRAEFHEPNPFFKYEIIIQPKMSFGTGHHETTHLIVEYLLGKEMIDLNILDMGCGTGILGILAKMMNAKHVVGIDIDNWAVENAKENAQRNNVEMEFRLGGAEKLRNETFDMIIANINKNILIRDIPSYLNVLKPKGTLILSGILDIDFEEIKVFGEGLELSFIKQKQRNEWVALEFVYGELN